LSEPPTVYSRRPNALATMITALCALMIARLAWQDPKYLIPLCALPVVINLPAYLARRRMQEVLLSGDVKRVLGTWAGAPQRILFPETMAPIMSATAYAAYGWLEEAHTALDRAAKGPAWDAALEQRLFVETLLQTLGAGPLVRLRIRRLRRGLVAFARAFAHRAMRGDAGWLRAAAKSSPLVHWAMRYAGAVLAIYAGDRARALELLEGAPSWPQQSAFRTFDQELRSQLA
jgi:hypothetical protein